MLNIFSGFLDQWFWYVELMQQIVLSWLLSPSSVHSLGLLFNHVHNGSRQKKTYILQSGWPWGGMVPSGCNYFHQTHYFHYVHMCQVISQFHHFHMLERSHNPGCPCSQCNLFRTNLSFFFFFCSMYDVDGNGWIDLLEMTKMVRSIYQVKQFIDNTKREQACTARKMQ